MKGECIMENIATLVQPNSNLIELNDEELEVVSGGIVAAVVGALGVTTGVAIEGLRNPASRARDILIDQILQGGAGAAIGVLGAVATGIVAGVPITATAASLSDS
jgi:uncharacterized ferredoxin-like protein